MTRGRPARWPGSRRVTSWGAAGAGFRGGGRLSEGGLLCCALDTELLGHWWYEGPAWLAAVLEEAPRQGVDLVTVGEGIDRVEAEQAEPCPATWGSGKALTTWDSPSVGQMAIAARRHELRTVAAAAGHPEPRAALERRAGELLAVQASDWAFMATRELAGDYPRERLEAHVAGLDAALGALTD